MSKPENSFRSAMIGGFDRQDVLDYLKTQSLERSRAEDGYRQTIARLESENEEARRLNDKSAECEQLQDRVRVVEEECRLLREQNDGLLIKLAEVSEESRKKELEGTRLEGELERLRLKMLEQTENERREVSRYINTAADSVEQWYGATEKEYAGYVTDINNAYAEVLDALDSARELVMAAPSLVTQLQFPSFNKPEFLMLVSGGNGEEPADAPPPECAEKTEELFTAPEPEPEDEAKDLLAPPESDPKEEAEVLLPAPEQESEDEAAAFSEEHDQESEEDAAAIVEAQTVNGLPPHPQLYVSTKEVIFVPRPEMIKTDEGFEPVGAAYWPTVEASPADNKDEKRGGGDDSAPVSWPDYVN